jgi:hypothetical protein
MPTKFELALERLLGYERFFTRSKITYIRLNSQTPCPPRGAARHAVAVQRRLIPVNPRVLSETLSLATPGSLSVMAATIPAM